MRLDINEDITVSHTLPGEFYNSEEYFNLCIEKIFKRSWQFITDERSVSIPGSVYPFSFIESIYEEPLVLIRNNDDVLRCLSNVCTHRGNILITNPGQMKTIRCRYHGRRFDLDGKFVSMPEFEECKNFNPENESLKKLPIERLGNFLFTAVDPVFPFAELIEDIKKRLQWFPFNRLQFEPAYSRDYLVKANWALYIDNYLEGFHIPFVHAGLNAKLDYGNYYSLVFKYSNLQVGISKGSEETFEIPEGSPDFGKEIGAYYYWLFPNIMLNFYPWGVSVNVIKPMKKDLTKVSFLTYISDVNKFGKGAGADLDKVEREDESIVEDVQRGIRSEIYKSGRYSPTRETGVHQFHLLLSRFLDQ